jgi:hypothetical protein
MKPQKADWLAWVLQFIFGGVVGLVLGFDAISCNSRNYTYTRGSSYLLESSDVMPFFIGAALLGGALASYYGDRLWMEDRVIPNDPVPQSHNSFACSVTIGAVGVGLMGCAILRTVGWMGR